LLNKEVGGELGISEVPVKAHRGHVVRQMKATSLAHLVKIGLKLRIAKRATESAALVEMPKAASRFA
jgi:DNA-binding NarL/FixJ family response regulator